MHKKNSVCVSVMLCACALEKMCKQHVGKKQQNMAPLDTGEETGEETGEGLVGLVYLDFYLVIFALRLVFRLALLVSCVFRCVAGSTPVQSGWGGVADVWVCMCVLCGRMGVHMYTSG